MTVRDSQPRPPPLLLRLYLAVLLAVPALVHHAPQAVAQQQAAERLTPRQQREVVQAVASAYADRYVFEDKGRLIADHLRRQLARRAFDRATDPASFAAALTEAIRQVSSDRHIEVFPPAPPPAAAGAQPGEPGRAERLSWVERLRRRNFDFIRVERLPGNVGLLRLDSFPPPELATETAAAAMAFLKNSDAIIIDLRENGGGTGDMVRFLASYFFVEPTRLSRTFRRDGNPQVTFDSTLPTIPGQRMPIIDLFVLTSGRTISAAEGFAFALQQRDRAVIVGETTAGAANAGDLIDVGHGFRAFVPDVHVTSPIDGTSWEGRGVVPNIAVPAAQALSAAHREAVRRLLAAATDERTRNSLRRALETPPS